MDEKVARNQWNVLRNRMSIHSNTIMIKSIESRMNKVNMPMVQVVLFFIVHVESIISL